MGHLHIHSGALTASKSYIFWNFRPVFLKPYGRSGSELAAPNYPGVFI